VLVPGGGSGWSMVMRSLDDANWAADAEYDDDDDAAAE